MGGGILLMILYLANIETKEFTGTRELSELERNPKYGSKTHDPVDEYIYDPRVSSLSPPPSTNENQVAVLTMIGWEIRDDFRGEYWDTATKTRHIIADIGAEPDSTWTDVPPGPRDKWDGSGWAEDPMAKWEADIAATDADMPRYVEDLWDTIGIAQAPAYTQEIYNNKKIIRSQKPAV